MWQQLMALYVKMCVQASRALLASTVKSAKILLFLGTTLVLWSFDALRKATRVFRARVER